LRNLIESDTLNVNKPLVRREIDVPSCKSSLKEEFLKNLSPKADFYLLSFLVGSLLEDCPAIHLLSEFLLNQSPPDRPLPTSSVEHQALGQ
jgi:hypothetical protein